MGSSRQAQAARVVRQEPEPAAEDAAPPAPAEEPAAVSCAVASAGSAAVSSSTAWIGRRCVPGSLSGAAVLCLVFVPFALGHYLSCLLRTVNAVLAPQLMAAAALTPGDLGLLTSAYFLAFACAQLPVGMALDRYGPRLVQLPMLLLAALGTFGFAISSGFTEMLCARALMGLGLAGCFMGAVKAVSTWVSPARLPSVQGYLIAAGGLGAASSTLPVRLFLQYADWRWLFVALAVACVVAGALIFVAAPTPPATPRKPFRLAVLAEVFRHRTFRDTATLVLIPHTVFFGMQGLWVGRWLTDVGRLPEGSVAWLLYLGMAAVVLGAVAVGMVTEWAAKRGADAITVAGVGVALFIIVQCGCVFGWRPSLPMLSVLFTLVGTITGIEYTIIAQAMPPALTGRASTCLNLLIFTGAFLVQAGFGHIVGLWQPDLQGRYPAVAYQAGFFMLVLLQLPGVAWFVLRRRRAPGRNAVESPL
ncbi:putative MFS family arabinose efflux permease [Pseudoduganella lurida]|uniref:Putative MFS family arabinose efflux permease n=1 Tax=Pseudoduganella lurida TaxID=1036180 RepID=A0A562RAY7_9BURK|nr:MFS transporter [Pseudoduganella lurida]TWI66242.1 putative MFS family arabinose efflux permease [Pseudoduganella lurida]